MNLNVEEWKPFRIDSIFNIYTGGDLIMGEIEEGTIPIASNSATNNNIAAYTAPIPNRKLFDHTKTISIADRGKFWAFIQPQDFYLATRAKGLECKDSNILNEYQMAFIVSIINQESFKYNYGRNCCANLPNIEICLPIQHDNNGNPLIDKSNLYSDSGYVPDWEKMEEYIKTLHWKKLTTKNNSCETLSLDNICYSEFRFGSLITDIYKAKAINKDDVSMYENKGKYIRYITRTADNNGCELLVDISSIDDDYIEKGNAITIGDTTATCFYQNEDFITGDHMVVIRADWLNVYTGMYVVTLLNEEQYRYSYGRAFIMDRIKNTMLYLPVNSDGKPDWKFMEDFIKSLPYGDRLEG